MPHRVMFSEMGGHINLLKQIKYTHNLICQTSMEGILQKYKEKHNIVAAVIMYKPMLIYMCCGTIRLSDI